MAGFVTALANLPENRLGCQDLATGLPQQVQSVQLGEKEEWAGVRNPQLHPKSSRAAWISASTSSSRRLIAGTPIRPNS